MLRERGAVVATLSLSFNASTIERVISSCNAKIPWNSRSKVSDHKVNPFHASISSAVTRTRLPSRRTVPSSTCSTFNFSAISVSSEFGFFAFEPKGRSARRDPETIDFGQRGENLLGNSVAEIIVVSCGT